MADTPPASPPATTLPPVSNAPISLQDVMSAGLASLIALVTLVLLCYCFWGASAVTTEHFKNQKDVLALALGLFGTVTGYYFGRTPAERQAQQATRTADATQSQLTKTQDQLTTQQDKTQDHLTAQQDKVTSAQVTAQAAQQQTQAVKAEVTRELVALSAATIPPDGQINALAAAAPALTPAQVQARLAALLDRVNLI